MLVIDGRMLSETEHAMTHKKNLQGAVDLSTLDENFKVAYSASSCCTACISVFTTTVWVDTDVV